MEFDSFPGSTKPPAAPSMSGPKSSSGGVAPRQDKSLAWTLRFLNILKYAVIAGTVVVVRLNVPPYINGLRQMFPQSPVEAFLGNIPFIGGIFTAGGTIGVFIGGCALWALFQGFEVLPAILLGNRAAVKLLANSKTLGAADTMTINGSDPSAVRWLKGIYNKLPFAWLRKMKTFQAVAYLGDLLFVTSFYPPLIGGGFSLANFALVCVLLFSFQVAIGLYTMVVSIEASIKEGLRNG